MKHLFISLLLVFTIVLSSCTQGPYAVKYTASGNSGTLYVTYIDENGITENYTGPSPWHYSFTTRYGASLKVSANCDVTGTTEVHIFINGVDKVSDTETGFNATASTKAE